MENQNNMCDVTHDFHTLSHFLSPHSPLVRDVHYGRPFEQFIKHHSAVTGGASCLNYSAHEPYTTAQCRSFAYVGSLWAWNYCLPQSLRLELGLLSVSSLQLRRHLKTLLFAGPSTEAVWKRCWLEWRYIIIWLHYITLSLYFFSYLWVQNRTSHNFKELD